MSWERLSAPKVHGGMGFKDLSAFNLAMLGKQGLKFLSKPDTLFPVFLKCGIPHLETISQFSLATIPVVYGRVFCAIDLSFMVVLVGVLVMVHLFRF
jgi:hypothetical protein